MNLFQAFILGLTQGLTEFLPVSSSAHLIIVPWLFKWEDPGLAFDVFLHLGTLLALVAYFFKDLWEVVVGGVESIVERKIGFNRDRIVFWMIVIGTIPGVAAGLFLNKTVEAHFRYPLLIAMTLSLVGFLIYWIDGKYTALRHFEELGFQEALLIGIAQAFAIVPGVSRSGSTIGMARYLGFNREAAARFSFLLSVPIIFGAIVFESRHLLEEMGTRIQWDYLVVGFLASFISGIVCIHFLLQYLRNANLAVFTWYRTLLAIFIVIWSLIVKG